MKILNPAIIRDNYDVVVVGAGIGGLTAAALLAKRGLDVLVIEQHYLPGGCCTTIRRRDFSFDVGPELFYGFGEKGYNPHRFVMNEIEEEIDLIPHDYVYRMRIFGKRLTFWRDFERFFKELADLFPHQEAQLRALFDRFHEIFRSIVTEDMMPMPPTEVPVRETVKMILRDPVPMMKVWWLMFKNTKYIVDQYITDPKIINIFDIITATFTSCDLQDTPALLSATMFIDNHEGGACYASGSPQMLPNKLEKAIEKFGGQILYRHLVDEILFADGKACGVRLADGTEIRADRIVSNATVWNLYGKLVRPEHIPAKRMKWAQGMVPTLSVLILYLGVDAGAIPGDAAHVEMFVEDASGFEGKGNFNVMIPSLEDPSICPTGMHAVTVVSPTSLKWPKASDPEYRSEEYQRLKKEEAEKVLDRMERVFPDLRKHIQVMEIGTPSTVERYTLRNWGNLGGPKPSMGQSMMKRLRARSDWPGLYLCGDSTVAGEGIVATTSSGIGAANMILRDLGMQEYLPRPVARQYIRFVRAGHWTPAPGAREPITEASAMRLARECQTCEDAGCVKSCPAGIDLPGFHRRIEAGNFAGAVRLMREMNPLAEVCGHLCPSERLCEKKCNRLDFDDKPVRIRELHRWVSGRVAGNGGLPRCVPAQNGTRVAVVGAGPAGLTCAHFLARLGYRVDIMEKADRPGGMPARAVPRFRLAEEIVSREIDEVSLPGMVFHYGSALGKGIALADLRKEYGAVFLAPGLWAGKKPEITGMNGVQAVDALGLLCACRGEGEVKVGRKVLVVGGGSVAADAALTVKRRGAEKVSLVCLERKEEMPALATEIAQLDLEGIEVHDAWGPRAFASDSRMLFAGCISVMDDQGRFNPCYDESRSLELDFDQVIWAVGQTVEPELARTLRKEFDREDRIEVNERMEVIGHPGIFAGGDIVRGAGTVVQAVADGRIAAGAIDLLIRKGR